MRLRRRVIEEQPRLAGDLADVERIVHKQEHIYVGVNAVLS
jgi:hypothetical protein